MHVNHISTRLKALESRVLANQSPLQRSRIIAMGIASAIAYGLQLPTSPVVNVDLNYFESHEAMVEKLVSNINETFILDVKLIMTLIESIYKLRYNMVFQPDLFVSLFDHLALSVDGLLPDLIRADISTMAGKEAVEMTREIVFEFRSVSNG